MTNVTCGINALYFALFRASQCGVDAIQGRRSFVACPWLSYCAPLALWGYIQIGGSRLLVEQLDSTIGSPKLLFALNSALLSQLEGLLFLNRVIGPLLFFDRESSNERLDRIRGRCLPTFTTGVGEYGDSKIARWLNYRDRIERTGAPDVNACRRCVKVL